MCLQGSYCFCAATTERTATQLCNASLYVCYTQGRFTIWEASTPSEWRGCESPLKRSWSLSKAREDVVHGMGFSGGVAAVSVFHFFQYSNIPIFTQFLVVSHQALSRKLPSIKICMTLKMLYCLVKKSIF